MLEAYFSVEDKRIVQASNLTAKTFINSPVYVEIFRGTEDARFQMMQYLFQQNIAMMSQKETNILKYYFDHNGIMECFFMLISNESSKTSFWEKLIWGVYQLPFRCGIAASLRLLQVSNHVDRIEERIMKDHPKFLHLMRMVVDPLKQGQGYHVLMYLSV